MPERPRPIVVEVCVNDVGGTAAARLGGADRVELCASLSEGGTTPTIGFVRRAAAQAGPLGLQVVGAMCSM
ncbi:MAG: copper homeostasis protein CutC [Nocardioides sp.]|uniref:copper homeostasis protein CutC n=1 Tax=Nocardioides sp. TaxID=35761 RepID=UPI003267B576